MKLLLKDFMSGIPFFYPELSLFLEASSEQEILKLAEKLKSTYYVHLETLTQNIFSSNWKASNTSYKLSPIIIAAILGKLLHVKALIIPRVVPVSGLFESLSFMLSGKKPSSKLPQISKITKEEWYLALKFAVSEDSVDMFQILNKQSKKNAIFFSDEFIMEILSLAGIYGSSLIFNELLKGKCLEELSRERNHKIFENIIYNRTHTTNLPGKLKILTMLLEHQDFKDYLATDLELGINLASWVRKYPKVPIEEFFIILSYPTQFLRLEMYNKLYGWEGKNGIYYSLLQNFISYQLNALKVRQENFFKQNLLDKFHLPKEEAKFFTYIALYLVDDENPNWSAIETLLNIPEVKKYFYESTELNKKYGYLENTSVRYCWNWRYVKEVNKRQQLISEHISNFSDFMINDQSITTENNQLRATF